MADLIGMDNFLREVAKLVKSFGTSFVKSFAGWKGRSKRYTRQAESLDDFRCDTVHHPKSFRPIYFFDDSKSRHEFRTVVDSAIAVSTVGT